jgi:hypothetical protein
VYRAEERDGLGGETFIVFSKPLEFSRKIAFV